MQGLENLTRSELLKLVRSLEERIEHVTTAPAPEPPVAAPPILGLDFVCEQALQVLDNSGIPAFVYETAGDFTLLAANPCMATLTGYTQKTLVGEGLLGTVPV